MQDGKADVVKFTWLTHTVDAFGLWLPMRLTTVKSPSSGEESDPEDSPFHCWEDATEHPGYTRHSNSEWRRSLERQLSLSSKTNTAGLTLIGKCDLSELSDRGRQRMLRSPNATRRQVTTAGSLPQQFESFLKQMLCYHTFNQVTGLPFPVHVAGVLIL